MKTMNWKIAILTLAAALPAFGQTKWSDMGVESTFADGDWLMMLDASDLPGGGNQRAAFSTLRDWWFNSDDTMTLGTGGGSVVLTFASTGTDPTLTATNGTVTFGGVASLALGTMIFDADQTIGAGQDNFVLTYDNAGGLIALEAATGGGNVSDNTSEAITGTWEIQDDVDFVFGNDANWLVQYDEAVDDQLLFVTTGTAAIATTDPMFEILVGDTPTADQQVFGIAKGSQATNTPLFTVDEDGDVTAAGDINVTTANANSLVFEGATPDAFETTVAVVDPTADRTFTLPNTDLDLTNGFDPGGAIDIDYGSADITDHTFTTDGTGTAEIVLPVGSIDGNEILNDTLGLADWESGTDGNLITFDAAGDPAYVATGTAGQVLTSNGAGAAPTFQAAAGGTGYVLSSGNNAFNFVNATNYWISPYSQRSPESSANFARAALDVPATGTVKRIAVKVFINGTLGTAEDVTIKAQVNATEFGTFVMDWDASSKAANSGDISQAVTKGDTIAVKIECPTWVTSPTNVYVDARIYIE